MNFKKIMLITLVLFAVLTVSSAAASEYNITDETALENTVETRYSGENDSISQYSTADQINADDENLLESTAQDNLTASGEFIDVSEAYEYLNAFRTGYGVWYWNSDDATITYFNTNNGNQLNALSIDENLVKTAQIRAKEIAEYFSHTRPDGTSCFTVYPSDYLALGENIAYGQKSCFEVTVAWEENDEPYSGQGHRRNMLSSDFNCVGIAGYKINGVIYWVQAFGYKSDSKSTNTKVITTITTIKLTLNGVIVKKSAKKMVLKATLKINRKLAKGKKITFKFNGKKYTAKTNKKVWQKSLLKKLF